MRFPASVVFRNFIFLFVNQFFNLIIPLLVFPFLVRTLGLELFGLYSITYSGIVFCFMFCDYGFNFSGSKYITINKSDVGIRDMAFSTITSIKIAIALVISVIWATFILLDDRFREYHLFGLLFIGMIIGNAINLQWFYQGIEQLGWYSTINSIIKLASNVSILFLVKSAQDLYLIPLIYSAAFLLTGVVMLVIATTKYNISFKFMSFKSFRMFLRDGFDNFVTIGTTSLVFNGTIIILSFFEKNILIIGAFATLDRIMKILVSVYVPYSTAIYPRNMANFQLSIDAGRKSVVKYGSIALVFAFFCILIIALLSERILFNLNPDLVDYAGWMRLFLVWLFFIIVNNLIGYHYMNGRNQSGIFRNVNFIYTVITIGLMVFGCYFFSFRGCIIAVLTGEILLTGMLAYQLHRLT